MNLGRLFRFVQLLVLSSASASAGFYGSGVSPGNVPWPGGIVPYVMDGALSNSQKQTYLDGLREFELAANIHFIPRTSETAYILFKYAPSGPNLVSGSNPVVVEINLLTRGQICHETGHALGLAHEHQRPDRDTYVSVLSANIIPGNDGVFSIDSAGQSFGAYDFESVMHYSRDVLSIQPGVLDTLQPKPGFTKYQPRLGNLALSQGDRALMAFLYGPPSVPISPVVTTTADGSLGSLRAAMYYAEDHPGTTVTFNIPASDPGHSGGIFTIKPTGYLPPLVTAGTVIDATTQPGYAGKPRVFLNGTGLLPEAGAVPGMLFYEANCTVRGLGFQRFPWVGIAMLYPSATGNRIAACWSGLDSAGNVSAPNAYQGIQISDGASGNFIGGTSPGDGNVISGNTQYGVWISGGTTSGTKILGNRIGTNADGTAALANGNGGVIITGGSHGNAIGGGARNVISGNTDAGVWIVGASDNRIEGNYIGLNATGDTAVPNSFAGVYVVGGASNNSVVANVISGNLSEGVRLSDSGTSGNIVTGNRVGTSAEGSAAVPNSFAGVTLFGGATGNRIGGRLPSERNVLSGNGTVGLVFGNPGTSGNQAFGNYIGTDAQGLAAVPNGFAGVYLTDGASGNFLGNGPGTGNLISANNGVGVFIADAATHGNFVRNNTIGLSASGVASFSNQFDGISISGGAQSTLIGGTAPGEANIISGNSGRGIAVFGAATAGQSFRRNSIFANGQDDLGVYEGSNHAQAAPVITAASLTTATQLTGSLAGPPSTTFIVEFFAGRSFLGQSLVTTNGSGTASFSVSLPAIATVGAPIMATATSQETGDTSAFSNAVAVTSIDSDGDGLPNAFESVTPGLNAAVSDAAFDNDGDGFSNLQEFHAGTNPNDSSSRLFATGSISGADFIISFSTKIGRFYQLEKSDLPGGSGSVLATNIEGTGANVQLPLPVTGIRGFFRVRISR